MSKEDFKNFVKKNPNIVSYVKNKNESWQKLYEVYDLYGEDESIWRKYLTEEKEKTSSSVTELLNMARNIDVDKVQSGVTSLQKALGLFSELFVNKDQIANNTYQPRAIYKKFED